MVFEVFHNALRFADISSSVSQLVNMHKLLEESQGLAQSPISGIPPDQRVRILLRVKTA